MRIPRFLLVFIAGVIAATALAMAGCGGDDEPSESERDQAVAQAQEAYDQARTSDKNLATGPCIAESLTGLPDWVVDIAHDPRQDVDDDPANQCQRYRDGEASHFVELTPDGQLIRAE
jgi:hypothetical protein